ncbi:hypothetical protein [Kitasatospora sp. NPDC088346]|uniref:hypothetical protein n=1 Tax=Kitasatospora sp. NPDC088346 TaxID=3364073 RepID=UPI0038046639
MPDIIWDEVVTHPGSDYEAYGYVTHIGFAAGIPRHFDLRAQLSPGGRHREKGREVMSCTSHAWVLPGQESGERADGTVYRQTIRPSSRRMLDERAGRRVDPAGSSRADAKGRGPVQTVAVENWAADWARRAREVPNGRVAAGFLVDLVADPRQHLARTTTFPVTAAAAALRVEPGLLRQALRDLADAGLLTLACHDTGEPGGEVAAVTLTPPTPHPEPKGPHRDHR